MKKIALIALVFSIAITSYSQKKKNGTVYLEHPAIVMVEAMSQAYFAGDTVKVAGYLADDFKRWNGSSSNPYNEGTDRDQFIKNSAWWNENMSYLSVKRQRKAYPDAIEYKDEEEDGIWVQTWDILKGMHSETGTKINTPYHCLYQIDKDNKIKSMTVYWNDNVFANIGRSFDDRKNGTIYDNHEYINSVKIAFSAFENGDLEKAYSFFADDATFTGPSYKPGDKSATLNEVKASNEAFLSMYTITAIDMRGYPDYLQYERGDNHLVQSWWVFRLIRKSDEKKFVLPAFYTHTFNDEGKIQNGASYINLKLLDDEE